MFGEQKKGEHLRGNGGSTVKGWEGKENKKTVIPPTHFV
jgi:hypothetical protein